MCVHMHFSDYKGMMNYMTFVRYCKIDLRKDYQLTMPLAEIQVLPHSLTRIEVYFFQIHIYLLSFGPCVNCHWPRCLLALIIWISHS